MACCATSVLLAEGALAFNVTHQMYFLPNYIPIGIVLAAVPADLAVIWLYRRFHKPIARTTAD